MADNLQAKIDAAQENLDLIDKKKDGFVNNEYMTDLFIKRLDHIQEMLDDPKVDETTRDALSFDLWNFLLSIDREMPFALGERAVLADELFDRVENILVLESHGEKFQETSPALDVVTQNADHWKQDISTLLRKQLGEMSKKKWPINEHYLAVLSYPKDEKMIRTIFERSVFYRVNPTNPKETPRIYLNDAHPFHLSYIAKSIGIPDDFSFTVYEEKAEPTLDDFKIDKPLAQKKPYKTMTLGELIAYEKTHLLTNIPLKEYKGEKGFHEDDEFFLLLLDLEGVHSPDQVVGTNLKGEQVRLKDLMASAKGELPFRIGGSNWIRTTFPLYDSAVVSDSNRTVFEEKSIRFAQISGHTCRGVHAADALLSQPLASDETGKISDQIFTTVFNEYLNAQTGLSGTALERKIQAAGHALELYLKHQEKFRPEQKRFFAFMIADLPRLMQEIKKSTPRQARYMNTTLAHLYEALELFSNLSQK